MSVRVLVVALIVQVAIAAAFAVLAVEWVPSIFAGTTHHAAAKPAHVSGK